MRHQPQIVLNEHIPGIFIALCHSVQTILFLLPSEGPGKGARVPRQTQGEEQTIQC